jgi:hypothetical protein
LKNKHMYPAPEAELLAAGPVAQAGPDGCPKHLLTTQQPRPATTTICKHGAAADVRYVCSNVTRSYVSTVCLLFTASVACRAAGGIAAINKQLLHVHPRCCSE